VALSFSGKQSGRYSLALRKSKDLVSQPQGKHYDFFDAAGESLQQENPAP
jgi:hypothetical protein